MGKGSHGSILSGNYAPIRLSSGWKSTVFLSTVALAAPLTRGAVQRATTATSEPGGKGVNVARALTLAGVDAVALLPAADTDPIVTALHRSGVTFRCVPIAGAVRTNVAITEPDAGSNSHRITTTARRDGGDWILSGQKVFISGIDQADAVLASLPEDVAKDAAITLDSVR